MSIVKVPTIQNTSGVEVYTARSWINFNGTGTVAIRASANVSSITDFSVGNYRVAFVNGPGNSNFSLSHAFSNEVNVQHGMGFTFDLNNNNARVIHHSMGSSATTVDKAYVLMTFHW